MEDLIKAVKSLLSDIEAMQDRGRRSDEWFGRFSEFNVTEMDGALVEWPNLAISADAVKVELAKVAS